MWVSNISAKNSIEMRLFVFTKQILKSVCVNSQVILTMINID